jgi:hypothetical protein
VWDLGETPAVEEDGWVGGDYVAVYCGGGG